LFDLPTKAVHWPNNYKAAETQAVVNGASAHGEVPNGSATNAQGSLVAEAEDIKVAPAVLEQALRSGCAAAIASEPFLTKWDLIMGDGDCGEAVKGVCEGTSGVYTPFVSFMHPLFASIRSTCLVRN
jgi:dihydroxyacetone kinase